MPVCWWFEISHDAGFMVTTEVRKHYVSGVLFYFILFFSFLPRLAQTVKNLPVMQEILSQEDPLEMGIVPNPVVLPGESHGQRSLMGYSPWGHKESDLTELLAFSLFHINLFNPSILIPEPSIRPIVLEELAVMGNKQLLHKPKELMRPLSVSQCSYSRDQASLVFASTTPPVELSFDPLMLRVCLPYS